MCVCVCVYDSVLSLQAHSVVDCKYTANLSIGANIVVLAQKGHSDERVGVPKSRRTKNSMKYILSVHTYNI